MKQFNKIIREIANEMNMEYDLISNGWITILRKNGVMKTITGYKFDINNYAIGSLADDKYATFELLTKYNFPVVEEKIFYSNKNKEDYAAHCNSFEEVLKAFKSYNKDVVMKPNKGTCGNSIYHVTDKKVLEEKYNSLTNSNYSISVGPYYNIENEYRVILLNGEVRLVYKKIRPVVYGNGKDNIETLLKDFNYEYFKNVNIEDNRVLKQGELYEYDWRFNLSRGAKASFDIEGEVKDKIVSLASSIAKEIGINFCSIDIIKTTDNKYLVMEINSGVMMENFIKEQKNGYDVAKEIYKDVIKCMMEDSNI